MEELDILALTNALTDVIVPATDEDIKELGIIKGIHNRMSSIDERKLLHFLSRNSPEYCSGGSPANVIFNSAVLGLKTGLICVVGNDSMGSDYLMDLVEQGISPLFDIKDEKSGVCYTLITKDGEKTSFSDIGVAAKFTLEQNDLPNSRYFHTSGYELYSNPVETLKIVNAVADKGARISFDLGDPRMLKAEMDNFRKVIARTDILFMTEEESSALTGRSPEESLEQMAKSCLTILKKGSRGSIVQKENERYEIPIYPVDVVSACGAGDAYTSGFLFAHMNGMGIKEAGHLGSYIASRVCGSRNPHLIKI